MKSIKCELRKQPYVTHKDMFPNFRQSIKSHSYNITCQDCIFELRYPTRNRQKRTEVACSQTQNVPKPESGILELVKPTAIFALSLLHM